jgi:uncharacterized protein YciI
VVGPLLLSRPVYALELAFSPSPHRLAARPAHRQRLAELHEQGLLVLAGPWRDDSGALLVFDTDEQGVAEIVAADPYYRVEGVTVVALRCWQPIVGGTPAGAPGVASPETRSPETRSPETWSPGGR